MLPASRANPLPNLIKARRTVCPRSRTLSQITKPSRFSLSANTSYRQQTKASHTPRFANPLTDCTSFVGHQRAKRMAVRASCLVQSIQAFSLLQREAHQQKCHPYPLTYLRRHLVELPHREKQPNTSPRGTYLSYPYRSNIHSLLSNL